MSTFRIAFLLLILVVFAPRLEAKVHINEIYPAPSGSNVEWVELYNDLDEAVSISNFTIKDASNNPLTLQSTIIPPKGFISATSTNVLNNSGDTVVLRDENNQVIESVTYSSISSMNAYVRCPNGFSDWKILTIASRDISNNLNCPINTPTPTITPFPTITPTPIITNVPSVTIVPPTIDKVFISEVLVQPVSGEKEWIEFYNNNETDILLEDWYLDDIKDGGASPRSFTLRIPAKSYAVYELSTGIFNNDTDHVRLLDSDENEIESFIYTYSVSGKTWGKSNMLNNEFCLQQPTKKAVNTTCIAISPSISPTKIPTNTPKPTIIAAARVSKTTKIDNDSSNADNTSKLKTNAIKPSSKTTQKRTTQSKGIVKNTSNPKKTSTKSVLGESNYQNVIEYTNQENQNGFKSFIFTALSYAGLAGGSILYKIKRSFEIPFHSLY